MQFTIISKKLECEDTYIYRVKPKGDEPIFDFQAGQYVYLTNPAYEKPDEAHPFSIASSPNNKEYLEFCIKVYGNWTRTLATLEEGAELSISEPRGNFLWNESIKDAVYLLGGIGISPIMSMLRFLKETGSKPNLTMLYGNRTPETIAYKNELEELQQSLPLHILHIFSHLSEDHPWQGHRGFITKDILENEVNVSLKPTFFIIGPPVFIEKMLTLLHELGVDNEFVRTEDVSLPQPAK